MSANKTDKLNLLIQSQEVLLDDLKKEAKELSNADVFSENERLNAALLEKNRKNETLAEENGALKAELNRTKSALFAKMTEEKLSAFSAVQRRIDKMYYRADGAMESKLERYERNSLHSLAQTQRYLEQQADSSYADILGRLEMLREEIAERQSRLRDMKNAELKNAAEHNNTIGARLKNEPLTENEKRVGLSQKSLEAFIGLNVLSKAGIFLFIIGIILLGRFAYVHLTDAFKEGLIFLLGFVLIAVGERFFKKEKSVFSDALISGGISVLYAAAATGYFAFGLFTPKAVFLLCIAVTVLAIAIALQLKSEVVCGFAAVGGYLPVVAVFMMGFGKAAADKVFLPVACVYFTLLAITVLAMSYNKRWNIAQFIGYGLHIVAVGAIAACAWELRLHSGFAFTLPMAAVFSGVSFLVYLMMPAYKLIKGMDMRLGDRLLLTLNTVSGLVSVTASVCHCFETERLQHRAAGFVFLAFAFIYAALAMLSYKQKRTEAAALKAFPAVGAFLFSLPVVPLLFGFKYAALAWAAEGLILVLTALYKNARTVEYAGIAGMALSALALPVIIYDNIYTAFSVISLTVLTAALWLYSIRGLLLAGEGKRNIHLYACFELAAAIAGVVLFEYLYASALHNDVLSFYCSFTNHAISVLIILAFAIVLRCGVLKNRISLPASDVTGVLLMLLTIFYLDGNDLYRWYNYYDTAGNAVQSRPLEMVNLVLMLVLNIAVMLFFAKATANLIATVKAPVWIYTAALSVSALTVITVVLMHQLDVRFSSFIISAVYIAAACVMLIIGFRKSYTVIRSGGLAVILAAFAKLCFVDTFHLVTGMKIGSYFAFGAVLIVISYFYQRFEKKLQSNAEVNREASEK